MNKTMKRLQGAIAIVGTVLMCYYGNWQMSIGVIMLIWANNFDFIKKG